MDRRLVIVCAFLAVAVSSQIGLLPEAAAQAADVETASDFALLDRPYMEWFRHARYGMFVHFGPFSQLYKHENWTEFSRKPDTMSQADFDHQFVKGLTPRKGCSREWAELAKQAGMKYMVFTTKHHEGFCLWDTKTTDYNSVKLGPGFDMVREYVDECRAAGLHVGFYFSLGDGHNPDGRKCVEDEAARQRFLEFTRAQLRELLTHYGKVEILWYDGPFPLGCGSEWEAEEMNRMVRALQPGIVINDRALWAEDFTCSEGRITPTPFPNDDWEACMTFNGTWGWRPTPLDQYATSHRIVGMLSEVSGMTGNLLLNVGPHPDDGKIGDVETQRLLEVGQWLTRYGEGVYGHLDRVYSLAPTKNNVGGVWSRRGTTGFLWLPDWPKGQIVIDKVRAKVDRCTLLPNGQKLPFEQKDARVTIRDLPSACPETEGLYGMLKIEFASYPR